MKKFVTIVFLSLTINAMAQVGIGNVNPKATLDISSSVTISETDGLLVPRVASFATTNPGADQNSMVVYLENNLTNYTIPGGTAQDYAQGFYYWDNAAVNWISMNGIDTDSDWFAQGTTAAPTAITDNIFTNGNVGIGDATPDGNLDISTTGDTLLIVEGDSDNSGENDNPEIRLVQDGGDASSIKLEGDSNTIATGTIANALVLETRNGQSNAPIQFVSRSNLHTTMKTNGQLQLHRYTTGTSYTGTATSLLAVDANGNLVQEPLSNASKLIDADGDTQIQVEESPDEDLIRFDVEGVEQFVMTEKGQLEVSADNTIRIGKNSGNSLIADRKSIFIGDNTGGAITDKFYNIGIGFDAMSLAQNGGGLSIGVGYEALQNNNAFHNTAIGTQALKNNTTGVSNIGIGNNALQANTTGFRNTGVGKTVLAANVTGGDNTAMGYEALRFNTGGSNTAIGAFAMYLTTSGANNVAIGTSASSQNETGDKNVSIGDFALYHNESGGSNVAIGQGAGFYEQGANNTFIGRGAGGGDSTLPNPFKTTTGNVMIGYEAGVFDYNGGNKLYIANSNTDTPLIAGDFSQTRVGINTNVTTDLTHTLTVGGDVKAVDYLATASGTTYADYVFEDYFGKEPTINADYKFIDLDTAVDFVKENGHLPNVKSYEEIKANNFEVSLSETSLKNLEKIEENFLYIAELKEMIKTLIVENKDLKKRMELLEKQ